MSGASANQAFFQLAGALIPALLFGGAIFEARRLAKGREGSAERVLLKALLALVVLAAVAEVVAIRGAIDGSIGGLSLHYVGFVVCIGTLAIALHVVTPWARSLSILKSPGPGTARAVVLLCVGLAATAAFWLHAGISHAQFSQNIDGAFTSYISTAQAQSTAYSETAGAREAALTSFVLGQPPTFTTTQRRLLSPEINHFIDMVDIQVFQPGKRETVNVRESMVMGFTSSLIKKVQGQLGGAGTPQVNLVTIAVDLVKSTGIAYIKAVNAAQTARQAFKTSCEGGQDPRCRADIVNGIGA
jgi:hypothetical protein